MKKVIPCLFTSGNLCFGVLSMILSSQGNFFWGALCIFFAMLCDAMDGRSARALGVSGEPKRTLLWSWSCAGGDANLG